MEEILSLDVKDGEIGERLDIYISSKCENITRSFSQKLISDANVFVNGKESVKNYKVKKNDIIIINLPKPEDLSIEPENIPLDIIYEDKDLLIVNKAKGMVVHPAVGNYSGTLVNALLYHCKESLSGINGKIRPGIVHRIDKDTSGLLIIAKNDNSHKKLAEQIKVHSFLREYEAIVHGNIQANEGIINFPIGRHPIDRKRMAVTFKNSKNAITKYRVICRYNNFTHLRLKLETGRTHQIRVHMSYIGHPVVGDEVYGNKRSIVKLNGQCLHAKSIGFIHPSSGEYLKFESELPEYFKNFLNKLIETSGYDGNLGKP